MAKSVVPETKDIKEALRFLDLGIKLEMLMYDLSSSLYWGSLAEIASFIFAFMLFVTDASQMVGIWLFVLHLIRGVLGGLLAMKKLPATHDLINNKMQFKEANNIDFPQLAKHMEMAGSECLKEIMQTSKVLLLVYFVLTIVCFILDIVAFFISVGMFAKYEGPPTTSFPATGMICLSAVFLCCDLYYIIWIVATKSKFPDWMSKHVFLGLIGVFTGGLAALSGHLETKYNIKPTEAAGVQA